jgi:hypothetical protein
MELHRSSAWTPALVMALAGTVLGTGAMPVSDRGEPDPSLQTRGPGCARSSGELPVGTGCRFANEAGDSELEPLSHREDDDKTVWIVREGDATPVPEAETWALLLAGVAAVGVRALRRRFNDGSGFDS